MFKNILLADSDVESRDRLYEILFSIGHKVACAPNSNEALIQLETQRPHLIILAENLVPEGGLKVLEKIRRFDREIKAVLLTKEEPDIETEKAARLLGVSAVVKKDLSSQGMFKRIFELLGEVEEKAPENKYLSLGRILVVDDSPEMRVVLTAFLRKRGFDVRDAASADQALMEIRTQKPALVLLDERMPGMDGLVALKKIKEFDSAIKVIMLTAIGDADIIDEAKRLGARDYITKPCDLYKLEALILSILVLEG